ncbi:MAG: DUF4340 domain-containing protein [Armatimonadetes bacterium]|nr:DUF4340 domain-containing protein [Armatimonadota bacterium]
MNKKNLIPIVVLALLIIIFIITKLNDKTERRINFFRFDSTQVNAIEITAQEDTLKLVKSDNIWMIDYPLNYPPAKLKIDEIFQKVLQVETSSIPITETSFEKFNVADSLGTLLVFYDKNDKILEEVLIGKSGNYNYSYARRKDDVKVYQLYTNISYSIDPKVSSWRKKEIIEIPEEDISKVFVSYNGSDYSLSATDSLWMYQDDETGFSIKETNSSLKSIISAIKRFTVTDFIDNEFEDYQQKFENPDVEVTVELFNDEPINLKFIGHEEKKFALQKNDETEHLYIIYESWVNRFKKSEEDLAK